MHLKTEAHAEPEGQNLSHLWPHCRLMWKKESAAHSFQSKMPCARAERSYEPEIPSNDQAYVHSKTAPL